MKHETAFINATVHTVDPRDIVTQVTSRGLFAPFDACTSRHHTRGAFPRARRTWLP
jgi:hypothetical protein